MPCPFLFLSKMVNMEYSFDYGNKWRVCCKLEMDAYKPRWVWPASILGHICKTQQPNTRPEPFNEICLAAWFTSQKQTCLHQKQCSIGIETVKENLESFLRSRISHHWFYYNNIGGLIKSVGLKVWWNGIDHVLLIHPAGSLKSSSLM